MLNSLGVVYISTKKAMKNWRYVVLALFISFLLFLFAIWLPNFSLVKEVVISQYFSAPEKVLILFSSLKALQTNFQPFGRVMLITVTLLFGLNVSLFSFYLKRRVGLQKEAGLSAGGIVAGMLGVGCASCGSFIISSLFGASASVAFLGFLPFRGQEFAIISIIILGFSIVSISKKIQEPLVCK